MPFPVAAAIGAGASILNQGINAWSQGSMNRKQRKWSEKMYAQQRADALQDWLIQTRYNSPQAQMQRYKEAGLNPNLIYGESNTAGPVRSASVESWRPQAPQFDLVGPLLSYLDVQMKEAQINNLETTNTVQTQDALLRAAQVNQTLAQTERTKFDTGLAQSLRDISLETAQASLRKIQAETSVTLNSDERAAAQNVSSLREAAERILNLRAQRAKTQDERNLINSQIGALDRDVRLKDLDIELKRLGIQPSDNIFFRILGRILNSPEAAKALDLKR